MIRKLVVLVAVLYLAFSAPAEDKMKVIPVNVSLFRVILQTLTPVSTQDIWT